MPSFRSINFTRQDNYSITAKAFAFKVIVGGLIILKGNYSLEHSATTDANVSRAYGP